MDKDKFIAILDSFVEENYEVVNGGEESYIDKQGYSFVNFDKAIEELAKRLRLWKVLYEKKNARI